MRLTSHPRAQRELRQAVRYYMGEASLVVATHFAMIYREMPDGIRVLVVKHDRQRPDHGDSRG